LWEISKKHDEDVAWATSEDGEDEAAYYKENGFDLTEPYLHSQEEINKQNFVKEYGEHAWKTLRDQGVYYPSMSTSFKKLDNNSYQYYAETDKHYSVLPVEGEKSLQFLNDPFYQSIDADENPANIAPWTRSFKTASKKSSATSAIWPKKALMQCQPGLKKISFRFPPGSSNS
jgi:thiosulfate reductase/polysulfide reductase chain A